MPFYFPRQYNLLLMLFHTYLVQFLLLAVVLPCEVACCLTKFISGFSSSIQMVLRLELMIFVLEQNKVGIGVRIVFDAKEEYKCSLGGRESVT